MTKLTPQDYLSIIELIKDNFETSEDNQVVEFGMVLKRNYMKKLIPLLITQIIVFRRTH